MLDRFDRFKMGEPDAYGWTDWRVAGRVQSESVPSEDCERFESLAAWVEDRGEGVDLPGGDPHAVGSSIAS